MPRIWKYLGNDVSPAQLRFGTSARTSSKFCCPASRSVIESSTDTLPGIADSGSGFKVAVTMIGSSWVPPEFAAEVAGKAAAEAQFAARQASPRKTQILPTLPPPV